MKIQLTVDSPILLKLISETPIEFLENGKCIAYVERMKISHRVGNDGSLIFNIDPTWKDFADNREPKTWK